MNTIVLDERLSKIGYKLKEITEENKTVLYYLDSRGVKYLIKYMFLDLADIDYEYLTVNTFKDIGLSEGEFNEMLKDLYEYFMLYKEKLMSINFIPEYDEISNIVSFVYESKCQNELTVSRVLKKSEELKKKLEQQIVTYEKATNNIKDDAVKREEDIIPTEKLKLDRIGEK